MSRLILTIDQTPCRASYGLLGQNDFRRDLAAKQSQVVRANIARFCSEGDRMARISSGENAIVEISAEAHLAEPPVEITLATVGRPIIRVTEVSGGAVDIFI